MSTARPAPPAQRAYWSCQIAGWGVYGTATAFSPALVGEVSWLRATAAAVVLIALGVGLSHGLRMFMRQRGWRGMRLWRRIPRLVAATVLLGLPAAVLMTSLGLAQSQVATGLPTEQPWLALVLEWLNLAAVLLLWSGCYFGILAFRDHKSRELREAELARALQASELRLLKSQLNPHFLFNALNSVRALIADEPERAQTAVTQLARTLRYTLGSVRGELVTLEEELLTVQDYLGLEALRMGERLRVEFNIAREAREARIPVMLLQTLVENAIKHGIGELPAGGVLRISAQTAGRALLLEVENPRPEPRAQPTSEGIGIANAQKRLRLLFGPEATLHLDLSHPARALVRVSLPLAP